MKKIPAWIIIGIVIALIVASKFLFFSTKEEEKAGGKGKAKGPIAVNYFVVKPVAFSNDVFATGKIGALNQVDIIPEVSGKVTAIYFKEGEHVSKGTLLVKLNDADLQAQLQKSKTQIALSEQKLERIKKLSAVNGVSQEELDIQQNELNSLKADQSFVMAQLAKTSITAPFSGIIGLKNVSEGSFVNSTTPIVSIVQVKPLFVEFSVPEKYNSMFKKGITINFSAENAEKIFSASIYAIEPKVDELTKTIKARAMYEGNETFYPGSFVKVYANLGRTENALMIPTQCVIPTLKGQKVIISKNQTAVEVPVTIGVRTDDRIQIVEGLHANDTVVTTGLLSVKKEMPLKLLKSVN
ncbi:MAG: efflux transporter, family, subunit [Bacteroidota bacterium]|jgi:membrane fusion protein (multidrug efflux system)|nr:efflux transporter, family, subunit [Bacteroidota bacterium]